MHLNNGRIHFFFQKRRSRILEMMTHLMNIFISFVRISNEQQ